MIYIEFILVNLIVTLLSKISWSGDFNMISLSLIEEIQNYLLLENNKFDNNDVSTLETDFLFVKQFICDLINGENTKDNTKLVLNILDIWVDEKTKYCEAVSEENCSDADLLIMVLENCNDEVLNKLTAEFGEKSRVTKLINEKVRNMGAYRKGARDIEKSIEKLLHENKKSSNNIYHLLSKYLERGGFKTDSSFYNYIGMSRQTFARVRDNTKSLSKQNVLLMIIGLKLNYPESVEFLREFGYSFKNSDKRDVIIQYILKNTEYNLDMVNDILYQFGVKTLIET